MGKPHIESRIRTMKKDWQAVYDMLHSSGFGCDEENNCATTDAPGVWDSYILVSFYVIIVFNILANSYISVSFYILSF